MNRLDRALGIVLALRGGKEASAQQLAERFGVSSRTIYRDLQTLSTLGVPVYSQRGRAGGFRLLPGYFLPPIMFTEDEALGLVVGLTLLQAMRSRPFAQALDTAEKKLVAAVPDNLRELILEARQRIGFEMPESDIFHPERSATARLTAGRQRGSPSNPWESCGIVNTGIWSAEQPMATQTSDSGAPTG
jgi:predicted DNA-binding transcriptional regulator YafY